MSLPLKKTDDHQRVNEEFARICLRISELLAQEGLGVRPYLSPALPAFSKLSDDQKREALYDIGIVLDVFEQTRAEGYRLSDSRRLIWRALTKFGWTPKSDFFDKISDTDIVQIFSRRQFPIFNNLNFFRWISYTIEELYTGAWFELWQRDDESKGRLYELAVEVLSGSLTETCETHVPEHLLVETEADRLRFWIDVHYLSPLKEAGEVVGFMVVNRCREAT